MDSALPADPGAPLAQQHYSGRSGQCYNSGPMAKEIHFTPEGYAKLKAELEELRGPGRMRIADAIREAKSHGDLKENAAYHEAKLNQQRLDSRIAELDKALLMAKIVHRTADGESAGLGSRVTLFDTEYEDELVVQLVGSFEADPTKDLISIASPLGEALLGAVKDAIVTVETPGGTTTYKVLSVEG